MNVVQLELWQLLTLLAGFLGLCVAISKLLLSQVMKHLDAKFAHQDELRRETQRSWDGRFNDLDQRQRSDNMLLRTMQSHLPLEYVRREDWIRLSGTIDAKQDRLYEKINSLDRRVGQALNKGDTP